MLEFGAQSIACLVDDARPPRWPRGSRCWMIASPRPADWTARPHARPDHPAPQYSANPYLYDPVPQRDERFPDPYNKGVNAEVFLYDAATSRPSRRR